MIYHPDSFVLMLNYCANLKVIRYESTSLNRMVADKSHCVIVASTLSGPGGGGSEAQMTKTHSCQSETSYPMMPKLVT